MKLIRSLLIVLVAAAFGLACTSSTGQVNNNNNNNNGNDAGVDAPNPTTQTTTEFALRSSMRQLWEDHVFWTRIYIIDAIGKLPADETAASAQRLMQNQVDIGNAIRPFYGDAAADELTTLLKEHIQGAVDVLNAAIAGDMAAFNTANTAWYANGYAIAQFLANANPNWPLATTTFHMNKHLDLTLAEAQARLSGDFNGDVSAYDAVVDHILSLADVLTSGIVAQFPAMVGPSPISPKSEDLHLTMRKLWEDHAQWTRIYIVDQTSKLPDTSIAAARLMQNQVDIGNAAATFYGASAGNQLTVLLQAHIAGAVTLLEAFESGDQNAIDSAKTAWYANADQIAQFLAAANPNWRLADLQFHMKLHLDQTIAEAAARLAMGWSADVTAYDAVAAHILVMADILSDGIAKQFPAVL